jgi:PhzF family phenazine biosynthesis protein
VFNVENSSLFVIQTSVFGLTPGGGNPCPLVFGADALPTETMQSLAAAFGHETAFILTPTITECDFRLRYFVPRYEMEMCVHATIAAVTALARQQKIPTEVKIQTPLGVVPASWKAIEEQVQVSVEQFAPSFQLQNPQLTEVAAALRIPETAIDLSVGPIQSVSTARPKLIIPLRDAVILDQLNPDFDQLHILCEQYQTTGFYPFTVHPRDAKLQAEARQFPKGAGYPEDPATGVAAGALAAYLTYYGAAQPIEGWHCYQVGQGRAMGRSSLIQAESWVEAGQIKRTRVGGQATILSEMTPLTDQQFSISQSNPSPA